MCGLRGRPSCAHCTGRAASPVRVPAQCWMVSGPGAGPWQPASSCPLHSPLHHVCEQHRLVPPLVAGQVLPTVLALWGPWVLTQRAGDVAFTLCVARHPFWICVCGTHLSTLCHVLCVPAPSARGEGTVWARPVRGPSGPSSAAGVRLRQPAHCGRSPQSWPCGGRASPAPLGRLLQRTSEDQLHSLPVFRAEMAALRSSS